MKNHLKLCQFGLYLNQIWYQDGPRLISLLMRAKFEENMIMRLHAMAVFCKCAKRRKKGKKTKKMSNFF